MGVVLNDELVTAHLVVEVALHRRFLVRVRGLAVQRVARGCPLLKEVVNMPTTRIEIANKRRTEQSAGDEEKCKPNGKDGGASQWSIVNLHPSSVILSAQKRVPYQPEALGRVALADAS